MSSSVTRLIWLAALLIGTLGGCSVESESKLLESAQGFLAQRDTKSAIIQLKSVLQKNPQSGLARLLLGRALLESGDSTAAEFELSKAHDLGLPDEQVLPLLARALEQGNKDKKLVDLYGQVKLTDPKAAADLKTSLARAYAKTGQSERARAAIDDALQLAPDFNAALLLNARLKAAASDFSAAAALVQRVTASDPGNPEGWMLTGDIQAIGKRDFESAVVSYKRAIEARASYLPAYSNIILIRLQQNDVDGVAAQLAELHKVAPNHPQTRFLEAGLALLKLDFKRAREMTQQLLKIAPENVKVLQMAGAIEFQAGSLLQGESFLTKAMQLAPELTLPRRLLAQTYLRMGNADRALKVLEPLLGAAAVDSDTLATAAEAYLQDGDFATAEKLFVRAARIDPKDIKVRTALALTQLSKGRADEAFSSLQSIAAGDSSSFADLALISAHIRRREFDPALKAIEALQKKQPDKPLPPHLRGRVLWTAGDAKAARTSFERALVVDPRYYPATASLAMLDVEDGHPDRAKQRFEELLKVDPHNSKVLLALSDLRQRTGAPPAEVVAPLIEATQFNPGDAPPRIALVRHYLATRNFKLALSTAQEAAAALPGNPSVIDALGQAQLRTGDTQQALVSFTRVATMMPNSPDPYLRLADAYVALNDSRSAVQSLKRALQIAPDLLPAQRALIGMALRKKDEGEALAIAKDVQKQRPSASIGYQLQGDIETSRKNWGDAIASYRKALQLGGNAELAVKFDSALRMAGRRGEADQFAAGWTKDHPRDAVFLLYAGDLALKDKNYAAAEADYREVIKLQPDSVTAHNNLAWLMVKTGQPGAVAMAERANQLAPNKPALMDTLALSLAAENQVAKALELQKKVVAAAPDVYPFRMTLVRIYLKTGDKALAKAELDRLERLGKGFAGHDEVVELLRTL